MSSSDHASGVVSREAKRLDTATRHDTLAHAHLSVFPLLLVSFLLSTFFLMSFLGLT
jgi:hypothetical protein